MRRMTPHGTPPEGAAETTLTIRSPLDGVRSFGRAMLNRLHREEELSTDPSTRAEQVIARGLAARGLQGQQASSKLELQRRRVADTHVEYRNLGLPVWNPNGSLARPAVTDPVMRASAKLSVMQEIGKFVAMQAPEPSPVAAETNVPQALTPQDLLASRRRIANPGASMAPAGQPAEVVPSVAAEEQPVVQGDPQPPTQIGQHEFASGFSLADLMQVADGR